MATTVVNMIPNALSGEANQDSEPMVAVNLANPQQIAGSAFTPDPANGPNAPIYVSTDGGTTSGPQHDRAEQPGDRRHLHAVRNAGQPPIHWHPPAAVRPSPEHPANQQLHGRSGGDSVGRPRPRPQCRPALCPGRHGHGGRRRWHRPRLRGRQRFLPRLPEPRPSMSRWTEAPQRRRRRRTSTHAGSTPARPWVRTPRRSGRQFTSTGPCTRSMRRELRSPAPSGRATSLSSATTLGGAARRRSTT